jgi:NAD(P)-dependent dehydrogenase (short-subunit alcohol dehydrogenase family)
MSQANWDRSTIGGAGRFEGKLIVVTGATSRIGRTVGEAFAAEGGRVLFCHRGEALGRKAEAAIRAAGGEALCVRIDVLKHQDLEAFVERGQLALSVAS